MLLQIYLKKYYKYLNSVILFGGSRIRHHTHYYHTITSMGTSNRYLHYEPNSFDVFFSLLFHQISDEHNNNRYIVMI